MNEPSSCEPSCRDTCTAPCANPPPPIALNQALERFQREAIQGVCDTSRYRASYYVWGDGPPLTFLHGLAENKEAFVPLLAHLSRWFRCIAYDFPTGSHGTLPDLVDDLRCILDQAGAKQSYLYAAPFGSMVALAAMRAYPERLPRAVLQAPATGKRLSWTERFFAWLMCCLPGRMRSLPLQRRLAQRQHRGPYSGRPPEVWDYFLACRGAVPIHTVGRRVRLLNGVELTANFSEVRQPVLLLGAGADELAERLPSAGRVILEGCGHFPHFTHPETLVQVIRMFLTPPVPCPEHDSRVHLADCQVRESSQAS